MISIRAYVSFLLPLALLLPIPLRAAAGEPVPNITHYDLDIHPDFVARHVAIRAVLTIDDLSRDSVYWFGLGSRYAARVWDGDRVCATRRQGSYIGVVIPAPGPAHRLRFEIEGTPGRSDDEQRDVVGAHDLFLLWSDRFYPISFEDWATVRISVTLPRRFQAIAPGRLVRTRRAGDEVTYVFETSRPTRMFSVFADDRWIRSSRTVRGIRMQTLLHPGAERFRDRIFESSADVVSFYAGLFGGYDFDQFTFVTLDSMYARRAFPGFVGYSPDYLAKEMERTGHDAHETALLWWGYTLGGSGPGAFQWVEGFGDYAEVLYDDARKLPLSHNLERARTDYLATPAEQDVPLGDLRGSTPQKFVHGKLPWLMHVLRFASGDASFRRAMRLLFERYRFRAASIEEFVAALQEGLGSDLGWWRREWLDRKGTPELRVEAAVDSLSSGYRLRCRIEQTGARYHVPLEIGIDAAGQRRIERVSLADSVGTFEFPMREKPIRVTIDPNGWLLARVLPSRDVVLVGDGGK